MNNAVLKAMAGYTRSDSTVNETGIYNYIQNHNLMKVEKLDKNLNSKFLRQYDEKDVRSNLMIPKVVGITSRIKCSNIKNYEEIAAKCVADFNSGENAFWLAGYGKEIIPIIHYNKWNKTVYVFCVFR